MPVDPAPYAPLTASPASVLDAIRSHARQTPRHLALAGEGEPLDYGELWTLVQAVSRRLADLPALTIGLLLDNSPAWAVLDLAGLAAGKALVPLPGFFSAQQLREVARDAGIGLVLSDRAPLLPSLFGVWSSGVTDFARLAGTKVYQATLAVDADSTGRGETPGVDKITYTSGSSGRPKGVCLSKEEMQRVAFSLRQAMGIDASYRHLTVLPLSTLLENIAGLYVAMLAGATCVIRPLAALGWSGMHDFDFTRLTRLLTELRIDSMILVPRLLQGLAAVVDPGLAAQLRVVAVGGAHTSRHLLEACQAIGLPVFQGYGLSECASVVTVNVPGHNRLGSVGRPLPHIGLKIAEDGEILVRGVAFRGYLGQASGVRDEDYWHTGDVGELDPDGYLYITGRKKDLFITAYGRNVSPAWVEEELAQGTEIVQAAVFGEGRSFNSAVLIARPGCGEAAIRLAVERANRHLPGYAGVRKWVIGQGPFRAERGEINAAGVPQRGVIYANYREQLDELYAEEA